MYPWFLHRGGGYTIVAVGTALLALTTFTWDRTIRDLLVGASLLCFAGAAVQIAARKWQEGRGDVNVILAAERFRRGRERKLDAEDPPADGDEELDEPAPWCTFCEEGYDRGVERCLLCGRRLL